MIKTFYATALIYWFVLNSLILHEIVFDLSVTEVRSELYLDNLTRFNMMLRYFTHCELYEVWFLLEIQIKLAIPDIWFMRGPRNKQIRFW